MGDAIPVSRYTESQARLVNTTGNQEAARREDIARTIREMSESADGNKSNSEAIATLIERKVNEALSKILGTTEAPVVDDRTWDDYAPWQLK